MSRHQIVLVLSALCFIAAIVADVVSNNLILTTGGWTASGLLGFAVVKLTTDKPL